MKTSFPASIFKNFFCAVPTLRCCHSSVIYRQLVIPTSYMCSCLAKSVSLDAKKKGRNIQFMNGDKIATKAYKIEIRGKRNQKLELN